MVRKKSNKQTVQETNDSSILSKASIAEYGYFTDPYLKLFCTKVVRRAPLIQRGYYIRAKAIDHVLNAFLNHYSAFNCVQIISLGAGFDSSYFRLKAANLLRNSKYFEVDFPDVVRRKQCIIEKQSILMDIIGDFVTRDNILRSADYCIIPCDLTDIKKLENMFTDSKVDFTIPTLFFSECALTYVDYEDSKQLCKWIGKSFPNASVVLYEQVNPDDAFGHVMQRHFEKLQSPLKRIKQLGTIASQKSFFENLDFSLTIGFDMNNFYNQYLDDEEKLRLQQCDIFDEFEEWHLKCSHYCIVGGFQGECTALASHLNVQGQSCESITNPFISNVKILSSCSDVIELQRFGHSGCMLSHNSYFFSGGFGLTSTCHHEKLGNGFILTISEDLDNENRYSFENINLNMQAMYHTVTKISENMLFLFGGRTSPMKPKLDYGIYEIDGNLLRPLETYQLKAGIGEQCNIRQPQPRWRHAATKIKDSLYIFGGRSINDIALDDLWSYQISSKIWKLEALSVEVGARHTHSLDAWNNKLVVFGGLSAPEIPLNDLLVISLESSILQVEEITFASKLHPRYSHSSHVLKNNLYVIGGVDPTYNGQPPIMIISLDEKNWRDVHLPMPDPCRPLMLHNHCSVMTDEHEILIIGGGGNCFSFGTYFNPDLTALRLPDESADMS